jgi:hypothetical protein
MTATKIDVGSGEQVQGVLPVVNGGSGAGTLSGLLLGNGTSAFTTATAPTGTVVGTTDAQTLTNKLLSDTFTGESFDAQAVQQATTLLASNDFTVLETMEITSTTSLEIPATSTLEILKYINPGENLTGTMIGENFDAQRTQRDTTLLGFNDFTVLEAMEIGTVGALEVPATSTLEILAYSIPNATETLANKTISGSKNTISNVPTTALALNGAQTANVATDETTTSTTFTDLTTPGPAVTVTIGASGLALVGLFAQTYNTVSGGQTYMGYAISGATTASAGNTNVVFTQQNSTTPFVQGASGIFLATGLNPGSTTFTAKYDQQNSGTGHWSNRTIFVIPL